MRRNAAIRSNLTSLRARHGLTLSGLAERSGIAKSALSKLESGEEKPTVDALWAIANAMNVPFSHLVVCESEEENVLSSDGVAVKFIERSSSDPEIEVYSMELRPHCCHNSAPHPIGVRERITVLSGSAYVGPMGRPRLLHAGDSHLFQADTPHEYVSTEQGAQIHVVIEYPPKSTVSSSRTSYLNWPVDTEQWEGVLAFVSHMLTGVANGLDARVLRFRNVSSKSSEAELRDRLEGVFTSKFQWLLFFVVASDEQGPYVAAIRLQWVRAGFNASSFQCDKKELLVRSIHLAKLAESPAIPLENTDVRLIEEAVAEPSWLLGTLATEVLLQHGKMTLPHRLRHRAKPVITIPLAKVVSGFSSRINVDHYDAFELLHPAYARQMVAVACAVHKFTTPMQQRNFLDVGTGPGITLLMLQELFHDAQFTALEPDIAAIEYLKFNTVGNCSIKTMCVDFLSYESPDKSWDVITSIGASHHFNTSFMMQKAANLLTDDGIVIISDEFLPIFSNVDERNCSLILHHGAYLLHTMRWLGDGKTMSDTPDGDVYRELRQTMTQAWLLALERHVSQAMALCRSLDFRLRSVEQHGPVENDLRAYIHFFSLELQAMVAGFDYEVEQKSFPFRLVEMAQFAGLCVVDHCRVFGTFGEDDWGGGTHVFSFRKNKNLS